jgi:hypothetical protein
MTHASLSLSLDILSVLGKFQCRNVNIPTWCQIGEKELHRKMYQKWMNLPYLQEKYIFFEKTS